MSAKNGHRVADSDTGESSTRNADTLVAAAKIIHRQEGRGGARDWFQKFAQKTSNAVGSPWAFIIALVVVIAWAASGPLFRFSDTWQLVINTSTTIVTFLMVFLIQSTQNRDAKALHLKLDELIRSKKGARNMLVDLENCTDEELEQIEQEFRHLRERTEKKNSEADKAHLRRPTHGAPRAAGHKGAE